MSQWTGKASVLIDDLILTTDPDMIENLQHIGHCGASDHQMLMFTTTNTFKNTNITKNITRFKYHQADLKRIEEHMNKDWDMIFKEKSAEESYNTFLENYNDACNSFIPKETLKKSDKIQKPIWMKPTTLRLNTKKKKQTHQVSKYKK